MGFRHLLELLLVGISLNLGRFFHHFGAEGVLVVVKRVFQMASKGGHAFHVALEEHVVDVEVDFESRPQFRRVLAQTRSEIGGDFLVFVDELEPCGLQLFLGEGGVPLGLFLFFFLFGFLQAGGDGDGASAAS